MNDHHTSNGPLIRARVVHTVTTTSNPADVTAIGLADLNICGKEIHVHSVRSLSFGGSQPHCTRAELLAAATQPSSVDLLVAYDLPRLRELLPLHLVGAVPWIGMGRLLAMVMPPQAPVFDAEAVVAWLGCTPMLDRIFSIDGNAGAARKAAATALLYAEARRRIRGGIEQMIHLSGCLTRPLGKLPDLYDDEGWKNLTTDELKWLATHEQDCQLANIIESDPAYNSDVCARALREWNRRRIWVRHY